MGPQYVKPLAVGSGDSEGVTSGPVGILTGLR
jgi:hypothetical protein